MGNSAKSKTDKKTKSEPSERKIEANQKNAQKSTGPTTEEGKAASRRNGQTHGLCVQVVPVIEGEDLEVYEAERKVISDN
jgi:hypothetical protein